MGVLLNRRRYMGASKQAKTLFEMYNQYFDGTVNSVVDTGLKLWDGTHNRWKMEVEYDAITAQYWNYITLFVVKPDVKPYSGIRVRKGLVLNNNFDFTLTVGEACTVISNPGEFGFSTNLYGSQLYIGNTNSVNTLTLIRDGQYLYCDYNGQLATLKITDPKTNNLNLLIGCDYKGANNETQRYYTGTIQKFVIKELPSADEVIMTSITNPEVLAVCYAQHWCASPDYMTKAEAAAVTNIGSAFNYNADITFFDLSCFTGLTTIYNGTTYGMTSCVDMALPPSLTTIGNNFMNDAVDLEYFAINEGCTSIGKNLGGGNNNTKLFVLPSTLTSLGSLYKGSSPQLPHADLIIKSTTPPGGTFGNSALWDYVYVPDESIQAYQTAYSYLASKIHGKSELPDKYKEFWP